MLGVHKSAAKYVVFEPDCKLWSCPHCAEIKRKMWTVHAWYGCDKLIEAGREVRFLTLTSHELKRSLIEGLKIWREAWPKLRRRIDRREKFHAYFLVPEQHKSGALHIHILTTLDFPIRWWKDNCRNTGMGYQAHYRRVDEAARAAWYAAKYLNKQKSTRRWPKNIRRVNTARTWPKSPDVAVGDDYIYEALFEYDMLEKRLTALKSVGYADATRDGGSLLDIGVNSE